MPMVQQGFFDHHVFVFTSFKHLWQRDRPERSLGNVIFQWLWMPQVGLFSQLCPKDMEVCNAPHNLGCSGLRGKMGGAKY